MIGRFLNITFDFPSTGSIQDDCRHNLIFFSKKNKIQSSSDFARIIQQGQVKHFFYEIYHHLIGRNVNRFLPPSKNKQFISYFEWEWTVNFHPTERRKFKIEKIKNRRVERDLENVNRAVVETVKSNLKQPERKNLGVLTSFFVVLWFSTDNY